LIPPRVAAVAAGVGTAQPRLWLAWTAPAGLARPPIPQGGPGCRLSIVGGSLAPPRENAGAQARQSSRLDRPNPGAAVGEPGGLPLADRSDLVEVTAAIDLINWFGDER
jgi:hypothetical protein